MFCCCVFNNGYATPFFELERSVRQRCPLSGIIFIIAVENLANSIRTDHMIKGINIKGNEYKLSQYADDTSCFMRGAESVKRLFVKLETFKCCSGLARTEQIQNGGNVAGQKPTISHQPFWHKMASEMYLFRCLFFSRSRGCRKR